MKLRLKYVVPSPVPVPIDAGVAHFDEWWDVWLDKMVKANPDTIFFYTIESTDIWEDDEEPKCVCLETGERACGGPWCAPSCEVCSRPALEKEAR